MKFLRSIFTDRFLALLLTMFALFGIVGGLMVWQRDQVLAALLIGAGIAIYIMGRILSRRAKETGERDGFIRRRR